MPEQNTSKHLTTIVLNSQNYPHTIASERGYVNVPEALTEREVTLHMDTPHVEMTGLPKNKPH